MPKLDEDDTRKLKAARKVMSQYDVALSVLGRGDASPYMTDEFREQLEEARTRLERYKVSNRKKR